MKVEGFLTPAEQQADPESITDEERFMFRKLGLRMKAFLLLGKALSEKSSYSLFGPVWLSSSPDMRGKILEKTFNLRN